MARVLIAFQPPDGGVAEHVRQLAQGLGSHGHQVELAGPLDSLAYADARAAGVPVHRLTLSSGYGRPLDDLRALRALTDLLRRGGYQLVHCHAAKAGALARVAARRARVPTVYSPHCFRFAGDTGPRRAIGLALERALGPVTAALVCVCEHERDLATKYRLTSTARRHLIYNGTASCEADDRSVPIDERLAAMRSHGPVAAAVTALRDQKTVEVLLDAAPAVLDRVPDASIAIVGDGPARERLRARAAALGLLTNPRFAFLAFWPPSSRYLRAIDVFVLPSAYEALSIGLLEALACGVPQVATAVGGTPEVVTAATGVLVPPNDARRLADGLVELLGDPERRVAMAAASRARHEERFGVARMVAQTARLYEQTAGTRSSARAC